MNSSAVSRDFGASSKIVDLTAYQDLFAVDLANVQILLVGRILESHLIDEDVSDHTFPEDTSFRMTLQGPVERNHIFETVELLVELV